MMARYIAAYYDYAPFGNVMRFNENTEIAYQFTGQEIDEETGLHNYRARLYDSDLGRFYAIDPAGQFASPFSYGGNNPVLYVDSDGQFAFIPALITADKIYTAARLNYGVLQAFDQGGFGAGFSTFTQSAIMFGSGEVAAGLGGKVGNATGSIWGHPARRVLLFNTV